MSSLVVDWAQSISFVTNYRMGELKTINYPYLLKLYLCAVIVKEYLQLSRVVFFLFIITKVTSDRADRAHSLKI